ncbi:hypothetical protein ABZW03_06980 [Kitasatospora sp. NPDC004799]|uniref:hypothetical protein n=1 Tax=Kitasatospora sp. NPDC004799 TaxID=3154460 RepID=UPI0033A58F25
MTTVWTRLTGWLTLLAALTAAVHGLLVAVLPSDRGTPTAERLLPTGLAVLCGLGWLAASAAARRTAARRKTEPEPPRGSSPVVAVLLGVTLALTSAAALVQASGPDGAEGRQLRHIHQAGAVTSDLPILLLRSESRRIGRVNRTPVYRTAVDLSVPFADGPRTLTLDVETAGSARVGKKTTVEYAPGAPELGARAHAYATVDGLALPWVLGLAFVVLVFAPVILADGRRRVHASRRFRPAAHLSAAGVLLVGAGLAAYVGLVLPSPFVGWPLAVIASATPWLAVRLVARTGRERA